MRLFFALPCPAPTAAGIVAWRNGQALDGKPVSAANLHVTLAFLGSQPDDQLPRLLAVAATMQASTFYLQLDQLRCWPGGLLHLAPATPPEPLLSLASQLQSKLRAAGFELEQRDYLPHLTLVRDCSRSIPTECPKTGWQVDQFSLFLSETHPEGVHYRSMASWKLR